MCGIAGYVGDRESADVLVDALSKLEYRGYDSAGLAVRDGKALAQVVKAKGRLNNLAATVYKIFRLSTKNRTGQIICPVL